MVESIYVCTYTFVVVYSTKLCVYVCIGVVTTAITGLYKPSGIAIDMNGDVYVADLSNCIKVIRSGMGNNYY